MKILFIALFLFPVFVFASDPLMSVYSQDVYVNDISKNLSDGKAVKSMNSYEPFSAFISDSSALPDTEKKCRDATEKYKNGESFGKDIGEEVFKCFENKLENGLLQRVTFGEGDYGPGGLSVEGNGGTQKVKFNAMNYRLWFGGDNYLPFQVMLAHVAANENTSDEQSKEINSDVLLDPDAGVAISFPIMWRYKGSGKKFCHFMKKNDDDKYVENGFCTFGLKLVGHFKNIKNTDGESEVASGATVELGGSVLFPVLEAKDDLKSGYLALGYKLLYSHTNFDDPSKIFTPFTDAKGNVIELKESMGAHQFGVKLSFDKGWGISAKWTQPINNKDYIDEVVSVALESQF